MRAGHPSIMARREAAQRARLARARPSTPSGDVQGEQALARSAGGIFSVPFGGSAGMTQRTAFIDNEVAGALGRGTAQVVLLGAGYDGRALRFGGSATRWFEVDLSPTLDDKRRRLDALGIATEHVTYIALDLMSDDLAVALEDAGHDAAAPSLFVCEGLFAYLSLEAVATLCQTLRRLAGAGSVLVSTFPVRPESAGRRGQTRRGVMEQVFRLMGERLRSEYFTGDPEKLMVVTGWRPVRSQRAPDAWLGPGGHLLALAAEPVPGTTED
jgi:methyltransferase (TIGR00027 family)